MNKEREKHTIDDEETHQRERNQNENDKQRIKVASKQDRKRSRVECSPKYEMTIVPLEMNGKPILSSTGWIRIVQPYPYTFSTFAKARWIGKNLLDVYYKEFGSYPKVSVFSS